MKHFLTLAFIVAFLAGFLLAGPVDPAARFGLAIGSALFFVAIGWIVARFSAPRWGALAMGLTIMLAFVGR